jgi:nucleoside-diphosphate-sugar epimerase
MRVLLTGGAGYVGTRVSAHLLEAGLEILVFDKLLYGAEGLASLLDHPRFRFVAEDIRNLDALRTALSQVEVIVHMAAIVGESACQVDPNATRSINLDATERLVQLAQQTGIGRFLFVSTCSNYGVADPDVLANEDTPLRPLSLYAETKVLAERIVLQSASAQFATCVLRLGTICGLSPRMRFDLLVNDLARCAVLRKTISIHAPDAWRPFLHIREAGRVIQHCLTVPVDSVRGRVFNVVTDNYRKWELADLARKHFPEAPLQIKDGDRDLRDYRVSSDRIRQKLGFQMTRTTEQAFLEVAAAVERGVFRDPFSAIYELRPDVKALREESSQPSLSRIASK